MKPTTLLFVASLIAAPIPARAGGLLGQLLFGSLDSAQSDCYAQTPGRYVPTWQCIRGAIARGRAGDMRNGPALQYMAIGDKLYANVKAGRMADDEALYQLAQALTAGDIAYGATHPDTSVICNSFGYTTICN